MCTIKKATLNEVELVATLFDKYRVFYEMEPDLEEAKRFLSHRIINADSAIFICFNQDKQPLGLFSYIQFFLLPV